MGPPGARGVGTLAAPSAAEARRRTRKRFFAGAAMGMRTVLLSNQSRRQISSFRPSAIQQGVADGNAMYMQALIRPTGKLDVFSSPNFPNALKKPLLDAIEEAAGLDPRRKQRKARKAVRTPAQLAELNAAAVADEAEAAQQELATSLLVSALGMAASAGGGGPRTSAGGSDDDGDSSGDDDSLDPSDDDAVVAAAGAGAGARATDVAAAGGGGAAGAHATVSSEDFEKLIAMCDHGPSFSTAQLERLKAAVARAEAAMVARKGKGKT